MAPGAAYLMAPQVPLDADESNAVDPVTCPLFSQQGGEPLSSLCTPFDAPIMLNNTADLRKGQNIAHCDVSSAYAPYTATIPLFTNAPLAPTHPVALFYHHVASRQQPTWNYCVTHPPPHPGFAAPGIASSPVHTLPNMNVHPISLAHLEPPAPCALSGTRAVKQPLTQQIFLDEILVDHRRADAMEQRSKVQELEEAEEREQKNLLKLFKETPLAERGHWSLEVSTFFRIIVLQVRSGCYPRLSVGMYLSSHSTKKDHSGFRGNLRGNMTIRAPSVQHLKPRCVGYLTSSEVRCLSFR